MEILKFTATISTMNWNVLMGRNLYSCMKIQTSVMIGKYDAIIEIEDAEECDEN